MSRRRWSGWPPPSADEHRLRIGESARADTQQSARRWTVARLQIEEGYSRGLRCGGITGYVNWKRIAGRDVGGHARAGEQSEKCKFDRFESCEPPRDACKSCRIGSDPAPRRQPDDRGLRTADCGCRKVLASARFRPRRIRISTMGATSVRTRSTSGIAARDLDPRHVRLRTRGALPTDDGCGRRGGTSGACSRLRGDWVSAPLPRGTASDHRWNRSLANSPHRTARFRQDSG